MQTNNFLFLLFKKWKYGSKKTGNMAVHILYKFSCHRNDFLLYCLLNKVARKSSQIFVGILRIHEGILNWTLQNQRTPNQKLSLKSHHDVREHLCVYPSYNVTGSSQPPFKSYFFLDLTKSRVRCSIACYGMCSSESEIILENFNRTRYHTAESFVKWNRTFFNASIYF